MVKAPGQKQARQERLNQCVSSKPCRRRYLRGATAVSYDTTQWRIILQARDLHAMRQVRQINLYIYMHLYI